VGDIPSVLAHLLNSGHSWPDLWPRDTWVTIASPQPQRKAGTVANRAALRERLDWSFIRCIGLPSVGLLSVVVPPTGMPISGLCAPCLGRVRWDRYDGDYDEGPSLRVPSRGTLRERRSRTCGILPAQGAPRGALELCARPAFGMVAGVGPLVLWDRSI